MNFLRNLFARRKREEEEVEEVREGEARESESMLEEPIVIAFISAKGGCGKSTLAASSVVLFSVLRGSVIAIDMDIANGTLTNALFYPCPEFLEKDDGISTLDYIVAGFEEFKLYKLVFPPDRTFSIQIAGKPSLGRRAKDIYVLPAKKVSISYDKNLSSLATLSIDEIRDSLNEIFKGVLKFAQVHKVPVVIFDFPPLRADTRKVYEGVFHLLEQIPHVIPVTTFDQAAIHGLVGILSRRYAYLKPRILAFFVNMAPPRSNHERERIVHYIRRILGIEQVFFIRRDPRWSIVPLLPPIVIGDPSEGASYDLIRAYVELGLISRKLVKEKLGFDPLETAR